MIDIPNLDIHTYKMPYLNKEWVATVIDLCRWITDVKYSIHYGGLSVSVDRKVREENLYVPKMIRPLCYSQFNSDSLTGKVQ